MKTIIARVTGTPQPGDLVIMGYRSARGGQTHVMHKARGQRVTSKTDDSGNETPVIIPPDDAKAIAAALLTQTKGHGGWMEEAFTTKLGKDESSVVITCSGLVDDCTFFGHVEGSEKVSVVIEEL